jgi:hypothetical protein
MVSLSLGFDKPSDELKTEIDACISDSIIVFASACNDGPEGTRTYPARYPGVICVHASNQRGTKYELNPLPEKGCGVLSFTGEMLRPIWGRRGLETTTKLEYRTGTSYATPVATAFAAFMISFIRLQGWSDWPWQWKPASPYAMGIILDMMSDDTEVYRWVSPTKFLKRHSKEVIEMLLKKRLVDGDLRPM